MRKKRAIKQQKYYAEWYKKNGRLRTDEDRQLREEWRLENPEKVYAVRCVKIGIRDGKIIKPKLCEHCKEEKILNGHHPDYSKPLEVVWLCHSCHKLLHNKLSTLGG
jgi:formylmethanofuran dehydrogenase subunit E